MFRQIISLATVISVLAITSNAGVSEKSAGTKVAPLVESAKTIAAKGLWEYPADIHTRNLFYGPGGKNHQPGSILQFVKEDLGGSNPKLDARDENGVRWKVKMGEEARPETVASRLLWAVGYHADEDYFVASAHIERLPAKLRRGGDQVTANGMVRNVRLERENKDRKGGEPWPWRNAPFEGTREFNGLRVMMALMNNWDLKDENNTVFPGKERPVYELSDLGATFGTNGVLLVKKNAKGNAHSYQHSKFITKTTPEYVDFATPSLPSLLYIFNPFVLPCPEVGQASVHTSHGRLSAAFDAAFNGRTNFVNRGLKASSDAGTQLATDCCRFRFSRDQDSAPPGARQNLDCDSKGVSE